MKNKKLLEMLASYLDTKVTPDNFDMCNYAKDALYYATRIPEFKRMGFIYASNDNAEPQLKGVATAFYKGKSDLEAAALFFDISNIEAQHLFAAFEYDENGYSHKSMFACDGASNGGYARNKETPAWAAARIRTFVKSRDAKSA